MPALPSGTGLAFASGMSKARPPLKCYIAAVQRGTADRYLAEKGFAGGVVVFAIPDYGILFRCRADGEAVDLEFGAFFALLRFIKTRLSAEKIRSVQIFSSHPEFVFAFTGKSRHLNGEGERTRLLREYSREFTIAVGFIKPSENASLLSPVDMPSLPVGAKNVLTPEKFGNRKPAIKPFSRGLEL